MITSLVLFGLVALPILPSTETASVRLQSAGASPVGPLLDEDRYEARDPASVAPRRTGASGPPGADEYILSVRRLGLKDVRVPTSSSQVDLDRAGIIRLESTGVPTEPGSNTFIVGHAIGYPGGLYPYVFYRLDRLRPGDEVSLRDSTGREYTYRVYDRLIVRPADYWVTYPVPDKTIVSLQGSYPVPTFERRLVVRAELVDQDVPNGSLENPRSEDASESRLVAPSRRASGSP